MNKKLLAALSLLSFGAAANASDEVGHWYVAPKIGYVIVDGERNVEDELAYGVAFGRHFSELWSLEVNGLLAKHDRESAAFADIDTTAISLDSLLFLQRDSKVAPYLTAGIGWLEHDPSGTASSQDNIMAQAGLGASIRLWQSSSGSAAIKLRPEAKIRVEDAGGAGYVADFIVGVGLEFGFGAPAKRPEPVKVAAAPTPPPPPPPPPPAPVPQGPIDTDRDGVFDDKDRCPGTPRGIAVDATGCPRKGSITLIGINFENDSAKIKPESFAPLDEVATDLKKYPRLKLEVQGHTDSNGSDAYNLTLSQNRAASVRDYLVSKGVGAAQLTAKGYGETQPVADNKTGNGRAQNRRVAMDVLDNPGDVDIKE